MFFNTNKSSSVLPRLATYIFELSIIISTVFVLPGQSATALEEIDENPAYPGKCYVKHTGIAHALGATWQVPEMLCAEATCYRSGSENKFLVAYQTCGLVSADPGCDIVEDLSLPYPSCCPTIRCDTPALDYESINFDFIDLLSKKMDPESFNEIEEERPAIIAPQTNSDSQEPMDFRDQQKIVDELAKRPSKLFDVLMNPSTFETTFPNEMQKISNQVDPILVRLP